MCPKCGSLLSKVIDTRYSTHVRLIRRRRLCSNCGLRYTTHEVPVGYYPISNVARKLAPKVYDLINVHCDKEEEPKPFDEMTEAEQELFVSAARIFLSFLATEYTIFGKIMEE